MSARLGSVFLSGLQVAVLRQSQYVPEHQIPGREGGITDNVGLTTYYLELHGFMESGDAYKQNILDMKGTQQFLFVPSMSDTLHAWYGAMVIIDDVKLIYSEGKTYPYYRWIILARFPADNRGRVLEAKPINIVAVPMSGVNALNFDVSLFGQAIINNWVRIS